MKTILSVGALAVALVAGTPPAVAEGGDVKVFGSYQDTDARDDTAGGGISVGIPLSPRTAFLLRASYLQKLEDDPLDGFFDHDDEVFTPGEINIAPLELGLRLNLTEKTHGMQPYVNGGVSYFLLDSDRRGVSVDDETGWFVGIGSTFGTSPGTRFFIEGLYRKVEATVETDPSSVEDVDDIGGLNDRVDIDLDGVGVNVGVRFSW